MRRSTIALAAGLILGAWAFHGNAHAAQTNSAPGDCGANRQIVGGFSRGWRMPFLRRLPQ